MSESKFEELTNLYFDQEISVDDLKQLKRELSSNADLRLEFEARYRLHRAACSVLSSRESIASKRTCSVIDRSFYKPSMAFGLAMAACFLVLLTTATFVIRSTSSDSSRSLAQVYGATDKKTVDSLLQENLVSKLRLAGRAPNIVSVDPHLSRIDTRALQQKEVDLQRMIEQMNRYNTYSAKPEPSFMEPVLSSYDTSSSSYWPTGFKSSLASFE